MTLLSTLTLIACTSSAERVSSGTPNEPPVHVPSIAPKKPAETSPDPKLDGGDLPPSGPDAAAVKGEERTWLEKTDQRFKNGEFVYLLKYRNTKIDPTAVDVTLGEWWPIKNGLQLITKQSDPNIFRDITAGTNYEDVLKSINVDAVGIVPDGMTTGATSYQIEGNTIIDGILFPCISDPFQPPCEPYPDFGIVVLTNDNRNITFTHRKEIVATYAGPDAKAKMDSFFQEQLEAVKKDTNDKRTVFFLPSIKRNKNVLLGKVPKVHRSVVRLNLVKNLPQIGFIVFNDMQTYDDTVKYFTGLEVPDVAGGFEQTDATHIFFTDGGAIWGQVTRLTIDPSDRTAIVPKTFGTAHYDKLTNFLVLY